ncbi:hypothetical protein L6475_05120 [Prevotella sp. E9-3]|uniref:hypothetical protein n=1 Tax=Prevotella sp. E9-3 TaxID=2913621 RepID=UPI001EDBBC59|nr:hypothetical protein [Prevotella sp. E9-3]UKK49330.1 hypothetical protein L6475_05120 [Prevotella sp. E9-3]
MMKKDYQSPMLCVVHITSHRHLSSASGDANISATISGYEEAGSDGDGFIQTPSSAGNEENWNQN